MIDGIMSSAGKGIEHQKIHIVRKGDPDPMNAKSNDIIIELTYDDEADE